MRWFSFFADEFGRELTGALKSAFRPVGPYLRRLATGLILMFLAGLGYGFAIVFWIAGIYLSFIDETPYATAAGWTGLVGLVVGLVLTMVGFTLLKPPRS